MEKFKIMHFCALMYTHMCYDPLGQNRALLLPPYHMHEYNLQPSRSDL